MTTTAVFILDGLSGLELEDEGGGGGSGLDFPSREVRVALGSIYGKTTQSPASVRLASLMK